MVPMVIAATLIFLVFAPFIAWPHAGYQTHQITVPKSVVDRLYGFERFILQNVEQQQCGAPFSLH